ncbi:hypothetical protein ACPJHQ_17285 [Rossellomorea sp. H39__3]
MMINPIATVTTRPMIMENMTQNSFHCYVLTVSISPHLPLRPFHS